ncbi:23S rRNA pseudouridine1911/1915/1917 synthase [Scopulibacillus darangshiensis]|uniref:Pseudouridine synthase n=1 Tax=Scopulibacillus darangshiensis TaxID=442528 RepID=A0A4R2NM09_9BACL|nr:RluA family pseudouridine synthase [Scopulibacillus darangshiensis]TCP22318.1 23S rRNA pseudouridine1911/1915/1917 synthase [Scopulibacillus darangshiensis]
MVQQPFFIDTVIAPSYEGMLLRDYLIKKVRLSRRALKAVKFRDGRLLINGEEQTVRYRLKAGDKLSIVFPPEDKSPSLKGKPMPLDIIFEDEHVIVINKPPGIPVIPSQKYSTDTLANGVLAHLEKQNLAYTVHTVTRLDRETSGLLLIAKHRHAHDFFVKMQKAHEVHRRYLAVIQGNLEKEEGVIDAPIGRKDGSIIERTVRLDGKPARTNYKVIKRLKDLSVAAIKLETGRTHQIRVHFSHLGYPLAGDDLYGGSLEIIGRQALHSFELSFRHPFTDENMLFQAPCPEDMRAIIGEIPLQMI